MEAGPGSKKTSGSNQVDYNALCVVTGLCAMHPEKAYGSLKNLGFRYLQFIACMDPIGHPRGKEPWSLSPDTYGKFLCRLFDLWYQDWAAGNYYSIRLFEDYIHILLGDGASTCATVENAGLILLWKETVPPIPATFLRWTLENREHH